MVCHPSVRKSRNRPEEWKWIWNCVEHRKLVKGLQSQELAFSSAELHVAFYAELVSTTQYFQTTVHKVQLQGNPRMAFILDQFLGEVDASEERGIEDAFDVGQEVQEGSRLER